MSMTGTPSNHVRFATTRWSLVAAAGQSNDERQAALEQLCQHYWTPLYAFLRQQGHSQTDAQDLTQAFILELLSKNTWAAADKDRGRFRSFLLGCLKNFLSHEREKQQAKKRGGSKLHFDLYPQEGESAYQSVAREPSPEKLFEQAWLNTVLQRVCDRLVQLHNKGDDSLSILSLLPSVVGSSPDYEQLAQQHHKTQAAMRQTISRLRKQYQQLLLEEIGDTVMKDDDIQEEIQYLFNLASRK
jgi:RNA polymerase sigma factor (sigma-70 family)